MRSNSPLCKFQTREVPSYEADITRFPSGLISTLLTGLLCPFKTWVRCPLERFHTRTVLSNAPDIIVLPVRLMTTFETGRVCPGHDRVLGINRFEESEIPIAAVVVRNASRISLLEQSISAGFK